MIFLAICGGNRQSTLVPDCLDDCIHESNPVRAVKVFVDALDLAELGFDGSFPRRLDGPPTILRRC